MVPANAGTHNQRRSLLVPDVAPARHDVNTGGYGSRSARSLSSGGASPRPVGFSGTTARLRVHTGGLTTVSSRPRSRSRRKMYRPAPMMIAAPMIVAFDGTSPNTA